MRLYRSQSLHGASVGLLVMLMFAGPVYAQTSRGTVSGTVLDSSGGLIFGGGVELTNPATGVVRNTVTNSAGIYRFDAVDLGTYKIKISMQGFKSFLYGPFAVEANRTVTIDATLEPGEIETVVEVTEGMIEASLVRDAPLRGGTFAGDELLKLPFTWLDPFLAGTYPGIVYSPISVTTASGDFSVNGQRPRATTTCWMGTDNNDVSFGWASSDVQHSGCGPGILRTDRQFRRGVRQSGRGSV